LVLRLTPDFALPFVQLARLDRPAGWQLLLAPCWEATALAGLAVHRGPNFWHLALYLIGVRGAGCA
jgi:4-hydroxybenzoate polyprenyltransferase